MELRQEERGMEMGLHMHLIYFT